MAVRIRLKRMGRKHRPFFRVCAVDARRQRDGQVIEELGYYDPMVPETDARAILNNDRVQYWLSVGAQPTDKVAILIKKYGPNGTHLEKQREALERLKSRRRSAAPRPAPATAKQAAPAAGEESQAATATAAPEQQSADAGQPNAEDTAASTS